VNVIREDPKAKSLLYVGTDLGVFVSLDKGETWLAMAGDSARPVHDLAVQPREGDVVLGTHGRSVYVAEAAPLRKLTDELRKKDLAASPSSRPPGTVGGLRRPPVAHLVPEPPVVRIAGGARPRRPERRTDPEGLVRQRLEGDLDDLRRDERLRVRLTADARRPTRPKPT